MSSPPAAPSPQHWQRRWLRLSLRGLIVLVLFLGCGLGWVMQRSNHSRRALATVQAAGGEIAFDYQYVRPRGQVNLFSAPVILGKSATSPYPRWLLHALGEGFFHDVKLAWIIFPQTPVQNPEPVLAAVGGFAQLDNLSLTLPGSGEGLTHLRQLSHLHSLQLQGDGIRDKDLELLPTLQSLEFLSLEASAVTDAGLAHVASLTNLRRLNIASPNFTDTGIAHLKPLHQLRNLAIYGKVTSPGVRIIADLPELIEIHLESPALTDADLAILADAPHLEGISIGGSPGVTDAGLATLTRKKPDLRVLAFDRTGITDRGLASLRGLHELTTLNLRSTNLTDAGLVHLAEITNLQELSLYRTQITDAGLIHLYALKKLRRLDAVGSPVTEQGLAELKTHLPALRRATAGRRARLAPAGQTP